MNADSMPPGAPISNRKFTEVSRLVYDSRSGEIVHTFHIAAPEDCELPEAKDIDAKAVAEASQMTNLPRETLGVIPLDRGQLKVGCDYYVHPKEKCLMERTSNYSWFFPNTRASE